jgi:large repetitive protein
MNLRIRFSALVLLSALCVSAVTIAADLTIADDVVVKFGRDAGMTVRDRLVTGQSVHFTSLQNDTVGGQSGAIPQTPLPGQWRGLKVDPAMTNSNLVVKGLRFSYAGGNNGAALELPALLTGAIGLQSLIITQSTVGLRITGGVGANGAVLNGLSISNNGIGVEVSASATPTFTNSEFIGNSSYGIKNLTPTSVVQASGNWWGATSGPKDTDGVPGNPSGLGDRVSAGVNYGSYTAGQPLVDCSIRPSNGSYTTPTRNINLSLVCRNAMEVRIAESATDLTTATFASLVSPITYTVTAALGNKTLYAEFRSAGGAGAPSLVVSTTQPVNFAPGVPQVAFTSPVSGATVTADAVLAATVTDVNPITSVQFFVNGTSLSAPQSTPPFTATWPVANFANGSYTLEARATNNQNVTGSATIAVTLAKPQTDFSGPTLGTLNFAGAPFTPGQTITGPGNLVFTVVDSNGVASVVVKIGSTTVTGGGLSGNTYTQPFDFLTTANGAQILTITATDALGNVTTSTTSFTLGLPAPTAAPTITSPTNNATVNAATVGVSGRAPLGTQVQLYLNGTAAGGLLSVDTSGNYYGQLTFNAEGNYTIAADARNIRGTTPRSADTTISFTIPGPSVSLVTPGNGATLTGDSVIEVAATAQGGRSITGVTISIDGANAQTFAAPPYRFNWNVSTVANGSHAIVATATDSAGRTSTVNIAITLAKPPPPVITPYVGRIDSVTPATSYGTQPITIIGRSLGRGTNQTVANASLKLLLTNNGFERRIGVVTDATGAFIFGFVPQATDSGVYQVALIHPEENTTPAVQANFTVQLARGFPLAIRVNASTPAGLSASGVTVSATASAQPSGALPAAVVITPGAAINVTNGGTTPLDFTINTGPGTPTTGTLILQVFANESGSTVRNEIRIDFTVSEPTSRLLPNPTYVQTGVKRGQSVSAAIAIENKGLIAANNVTLSLTNLDGSAAPSWIYLASAPLLGNIAAGSSSTVQISAAPTASVVDGIYDAKINVFQNGSAVGSVAISIAVTSADTGVMVFKAADIYTNTRDVNNNRIPGVANVSIRLQNDAVATQLFDLTTNGLGEATSASIPSGRYRYRATAANHSDTSGMVTVRPGTTTSQNIFLDYQVVSFVWSVNETTIQDRYDVTITATFQTQVPAPVVILEPSAINLPDMQVGEEFTGELTISNYGLVRADNVRFTAPTGNEYFRIDVQGTVPTALDAKSRVVLPYRVTQIKAFPGLVIASGASDAANGLKRLVLNSGAAGDPLAALRKVDIRAAAARGISAQSSANGAALKAPTGVEMLKSLGERSKASSCYSGCSAGSVEYEFTCANGDTSKGSAGTSFCKTYGASCGGGGVGSTGPVNPGGDGWGLWSWPGTDGIPLSPKCTPDCPSGQCCNPPGGLGG